MNKKFTNLIELITYFSTKEVCISYLEGILWKDEIKCPKCGHLEHYDLKTVKRKKCKSCHKQFNVLHGTMFENSKVPLNKWFAAIYLLSSHKKGISSMQLAKDIGVTQKTAWFLLHRVRACLQSDIQLKGFVECDETFIGGKPKYKKGQKNKPGRGSSTKVPVFGMVQRGGKVNAKVVESASKQQLMPHIMENIHPDSHIMTDEWRGYNDLSRYFKHSTIAHWKKDYVDGDIHTNTIEGFWSILKRGFMGIYHKMSNFHLQKYVDEFAFRYNTIGYEENYRFNFLMESCDNRLKYKDLILGKEKK